MQTPKSGTDPLTQERHEEIRRRLSLHGRVLAGDLAKDFNVSADTARRDLRELAAAGECVRVYGGALALPAQYVPLRQRMNTDMERKIVLARRALEFITPHMTIFLDVGSTSLALAQILPEMLDLTVATNAPHIAAAIADRPSLKLFLIGGKVDSAVGAAVGAQAQRELACLNPDLAFIGACAIDSRMGVTAFDADDAEFKRQLAARSKVKIVAAVNDKIGTIAAYPILPLDAFDHVIVERNLDPARRQTLSNSTPSLLTA